MSGQQEPPKAAKHTQTAASHLHLELAALACTARRRQRSERRRGERRRDQTGPVHRDEEPQAEQRGQLGRLRRGGGQHAHAQRRRRGVQAGEEGRGEEPEAAHEGPLPQALVPPPSLRRARLPPCRRSGGGGVRSQQQAGHGDAAGSAGQRGGVHQAAQGADRGAEAAEGGRRPSWPISSGRLRGGGRVRRQRRAHAGGRGAVPGRDAGRGAHQRGRAAVQAARGDHGAGAGRRRGGQRQLLRHRGQDLLHHPLAGAQPADRPRRRQGLPEAARLAAASSCSLSSHGDLSETLADEPHHAKAYSCCAE